MDCGDIELRDMTILGYRNFVILGRVLLPSLDSLLLVVVLFMMGGWMGFGYSLSSHSEHGILRC